MSEAAILRLMRTVERAMRPRRSAHEARREMKRRELKYCSDAGYGWRWFRGRRVPDEQELAQIGRIVAMHEEQGRSLYQVAVTFLRERLRTRGGREWSYHRVWRAYWAAREGKVPGLSVVSSRATS